jgi:hypothetical protein
MFGLPEKLLLIVALLEAAAHSGGASALIAVSRISRTKRLK